MNDRSADGAAKSTRRFLAFGLGSASFIILILILEYFKQRSSGDGVERLFFELPRCLVEAQRGVQCLIESPKPSEFRSVISAIGVIMPTVVSAIVALLIYKFQSDSSRETGAILEEQRALQEEQRSLLRQQTRMIALQRLEMLYKEADKIQHESEIRRYEQALESILMDEGFENDTMIHTIAEGIISVIRKNPVCPLPTPVGADGGSSEAWLSLSESIGEMGNYDRVSCQLQKQSSLHRGVSVDGVVGVMQSEARDYYRLSAHAVRDYAERFRQNSLGSFELGEGPLSDYLSALCLQAKTLKGEESHQDFVDAVTGMAVVTILAGLQNSDFKILNEMAAGGNSATLPEKYFSKYAVIHSSLDFLLHVCGDIKVKSGSQDPQDYTANIEPYLDGYPDKEKQKLRSLLLATSGFGGYPEIGTGDNLDLPIEKKMLRKAMGSQLRLASRELLERIVELKYERKRNGQGQY